VQKSAFLEYLSQKYPDYAYSIRSPGGTHYVMVSLSVLFLLIITYFIAIFRSGSDIISLLILLLLLLLLEWPSSKNRSLHCFKSYRDEIWQDCSSSDYTSIDGVGFSI